MDRLARAGAPKSLTASQIEDLRLAASKMNGVERRSFQAQMALKYLKGCARQAETVFGLGKQNIEVGLAEKRTGITCVGLQSTFSGAKLWEEKQPLIGIVTATSLTTSKTFKISQQANQLSDRIMCQRAKLKRLKNIGTSRII